MWASRFTLASSSTGVPVMSFWIERVPSRRTPRNNSELPAVAVLRTDPDPSAIGHGVAQPLAPPVKFHDARWSVGTR